ncbi:MAG: bifunctional riboflavin kinase/FAD synthetase [bacterium]
MKQTNSSPDSILTLGTFDGVHRGHQKIFQKIVDRAHTSGLRPVVLVFKYPPRHIINPAREPLLITLWNERKKLIQKYNIQKIIPISFTKKLVQTSPKEFVLYLRNKYQMKEMVVGHNFAFGRGRRGNVAVLRKLTARLGIRLHVIGPAAVHKEVISSSSIRRFLKEGNITSALNMLHNAYSITGKVIPGLGWGTKQGIPTANIRVSQHKLLPLGVFTAEVIAGSKTFPGVANIGFRPSIHRLAYPLVEVHILNRSAQLYGRTVTVVLRKKIRNERMYTHRDHLVERIHEDIKIAQNYFYKIK